MLRYLRVYLAAISSTLLIIGGVGYLTSPSGDYFNAGAPEAKFIKNLIKSDNSRVPDGLNDRRIVVSYFSAGLADAERSTVSIGSSRTLSLGCALQMRHYCSESFLNIALPGESFSDLLAIIDLLSGHRKINRILISLDPWLLNANYLDQRYLSFDGRDQTMTNCNVGQCFWRESRSVLKKYANLFSLNYLIQSIRRLSFTVSSMNNAGEESDARIFRDLSRTYDSRFISRIPSEGDRASAKSYGLNKFVYSSENEASIIRIATERRGVMSVEFVLIPYPSELFEDLQFTQLLRMVEGRIRSKLEDAGLNVKGSYFSNSAACDGSGFYDYIHPRPNCLAEIYRNVF